MPAAGLIKKALRLLGVRNLTLAIHDAAFPGLAGEDLGRGSPYSQGAAEFIEFIAALGFTSIQLGPQGITTAANPSPYDGSFFSRNPLSLAAGALINSESRLLSPTTLAQLVSQRPGAMDRVDDKFSRWAQATIVAEIARHTRPEIADSGAAGKTIRSPAYLTYRRNNSHWLIPDGLYQVLWHHYGGKTWRQWGDDETARLDQHLFAPQQGQQQQIQARRATLLQQQARAIDDSCFIQFLLARQHHDLRRLCRRLELKLFGDCQIGMSGRDAWAAQALLLPGYVMGAPPSRTNPLGQPWNYPLLDPGKYSTAERKEGAGLLFVRRRLQKMAGEFDGLRLDHPHGLICPWVYWANQLDPWQAVQHGARLFASPNLPDHPGLAPLAIVRPEQLNHELPRYADGWVADLGPEQLERYGALFAAMVDTLNGQWHGRGEIICEVLSTQPYPVQQVLRRYGLGRMRVTQKADLANPADVYRSENARAEDWLMLGNHDTPPIWQVADHWSADGSARQQAEYLARRLAIPAAERSAWIDYHRHNAAALVQAKFADLFLGPAQNIMVFFVDLFGGKISYNRPGTVGGDNWRLRVREDYKKHYAEKLSTNEALNIPRALAMALRAKITGSAGDSPMHHELLHQLEAADEVR